MVRRIASLIALLLALTGTTFITISSVASPTAQAKDADCSDFSSQSAAQHYFLNHGGPNSDPDGLDADGDGIACESNPCPCYYGTGGGGGGGGGGGTPPKKFHTIHLRVAKISGNWKILGKVPTYRGKFQVLRNLPPKGGAFKFYTRTKAVNPGGKVKIQVKGPKNTCFKVSVPSTKKFKLTTKQIGCIH